MDDEATELKKCLDEWKQFKRPKYHGHSMFLKFLSAHETSKHNYEKQMQNLEYILLHGEQMLEEITIADRMLTYSDDLFNWIVAVRKPKICTKKIFLRLF